MNPHRNRPRRGSGLAQLAPALLAAPLLWACAVGPDFAPPAPPLAQRYGAAPGEAASAVAAGVAQQFVTGPLPARWWSGYGSTQLDGWVAEGLEHNRDLQALRAALTAAQEQLRARIGATELPSVQAQLQASRQRAVGLPGFGPATNVYQLYAGVVGVSYDLDMFGAVRRANEAASADVQAQAEEWTAARQMLAANIVVTAIESAALGQQVQTQERIVQLAQQRADLAERRYTLGAAPHRDALDARRAARDAAAGLPALQLRWGRTRNALALLLGRLPQDAPPDLDFEQLRLPAEVPLALPSALVQVRPDIRAAEAALHAATARLGLATANLFPQITLTGSYGSESFRRASFLHSPTTVWGVGGALLQPLFEGGALRAGRRAADADLDAAVQRYQQTVLKAFGNVGDALLALQTDARVLADNLDAEGAAEQLYREAARRHEQGAESLPAVLASEQQWLLARQTRIAGVQARLVDTAGLFQALGAPDS